MSSVFSTTSSPVGSIPFGSPTNPAVAAAATGSGNLTEKTLELTFCSQFASENAFVHHVPWPHRIVWFGLTQLQENQLGFDAATSLGGFAILFQFKASHTVTKKRGRRFKVEHEQMSILRQSFGHHAGSCFYVFPDVGNIHELAPIHSDVIGNSWLMDVARLPNPIPPPLKSDNSGLRKDECHFAYLGNPVTGNIDFHSEPFSVRAYKAKDFIRHRRYPDRFRRTKEIVRQLKVMEKQFPQMSRHFFRNTVLAVLSDDF